MLSKIGSSSIHVLYIFFFKIIDIFSSVSAPKCNLKPKIFIQILHNLFNLRHVRSAWLPPDSNIYIFYSVIKNWWDSTKCILPSMWWIIGCSIEFVHGPHKFGSWPFPWNDIWHNPTKKHSILFQYVIFTCVSWRLYFT